MTPILVPYTLMPIVGIATLCITSVDKILQSMLLHTVIVPSCSRYCYAQYVDAYGSYKQHNTEGLGCAGSEHSVEREEVSLWNNVCRCYVSIYEAEVIRMMESIRIYQMDRQQKCCAGHKQPRC